MLELTDEERLMLEGDQGGAVRRAMQILVKLGDVYGATRLIPVKSAHMPGASVVTTGEAGVSFTEDMAAQGGRFRVPTTLNPCAFNLVSGGPEGIPPHTRELQERLTRAYFKMGAVGLFSCTPYLYGQAPRFGDHVAWGESSAVVYANSVLGARTNREGGPTALSSGLTGRTPYYGLHLDENRIGQVRVLVSVPLDEQWKWGALGYYVGWQCRGKIPVLVGIDTASNDNLKMMGAAMASSGAIAMFHAVGITPEAPTETAAFKGGQPEQMIEATEESLEWAHKKLNVGGEEGKLDLVVIGCPHLSFTEIGDLAAQLEGKKIASGTQFWIMASGAMAELANRMGYTEAIEKAGASMMYDICPMLVPMDEFAPEMQPKIAATNSAKMAHYMPRWGMRTRYGSQQECINAALKGRW